MFQPYHDVPGIEEDNGWLSDHSASLPQYNGANSFWASIDPSLESMRYYNPNESEYLSRMQQHVYNLEKSANGYGQPVSLCIPHREMAQFGLESPIYADLDPHRHARLVSPNSYAVSATASSSSEYSYSPDTTRHHMRLSQSSATSNHLYATSMLDTTTGHGNHNWTSQPLQIRDGSYSPYPSSNTSACNLKELQYNPDIYAEEESRQRDHKPQPRMLLPDHEEIVPSPETVTFADEGLGQSISDDVSSRDDESDEMVPETDEDPEYVPHRSTRKHTASTRRPTTTRPPRRNSNSVQTPTSKPTVLGTDSRVTKSPNHRRTSSTKSNKRPTSSSSAAGKVARSFPCTFSHYHCPALFANKNEWKRHVTSQHLQLGIYRCDVGDCHPDHQRHQHRSQPSSHTVTHNDFNRKDLFTQHHRRMHWPDKPSGGEPTKDELKAFDATLDPVRERCWIQRREAPRKSGCGVCGQVFESWEERMEHLGKHFEKGEGSEPREDELLTQWAVREGLVTDLGARGKWLVGLEPSPEGKDSSRTRRRSGRKAVDDDDGDDDNDE